jgi:NADPH2:quinone reductase
MGGGYAEKALVHPAMSFPLPDGVSDGQALSLMVQGPDGLAPAAHLHAPAGRASRSSCTPPPAGVGTLAVQLAKAWGAGTVIGVRLQRGEARAGSFSGRGRHRRRR